MKNKLKLEWIVYEVNEGYRVITTSIIKALQDKDGLNIQEDLVVVDQPRRALD